jgi:hypothetical protein
MMGVGRNLNVSSISAPALQILDRMPEMVVHSPFENAINLLTHHDELITIAGSDNENLPYGLICGFSGYDPRVDIRAGDRVRCGSRQIDLPDSSLHIDFSKSRIWEPVGLTYTRKKSIVSIDQDFHLLLDFANSHARNEGLIPLVGFIDRIIHHDALPASEPMTAKASKSLAEMISALRQGDQAEMASAAKKIMGLGIGLTPSGDDVLNGFFLCANAVFPLDKSELTRITLQDLSVCSQEITTKIASTQYMASSKGMASETYQGLFDSMFNIQNEHLLLQKANKLIRYGETSGMETLIGFLLAAALSMEFDSQMANVEIVDQYKVKESS